MSELTMSMFANSSEYWKARYVNAEVQLAALKEENERLKPLAEIGEKWRSNSSLKEWFPYTAEELDHLKARVAELEAMKPAYCVASGRYDSYMNELYSITDKPIPMADNFVLYRKEPANEG